MLQHRVLICAEPMSYIWHQFKNAKVVTPLDGSVCHCTFKMNRRHSDSAGRVFDITAKTKMKIPKEIYLYMLISLSVAVVFSDVMRSANTMFYRCLFKCLYLIKREKCLIYVKMVMRHTCGGADCHLKSEWFVSIRIN